MRFEILSTGRECDGIPLRCIEKKGGRVEKKEKQRQKIYIFVVLGLAFLQNGMHLNGKFSSMTFQTKGK